jgi:enoyl-CoA hydratase/carnithine racemase
MARITASRPEVRSSLNQATRAEIGESAVLVMEEGSASTGQQLLTDMENLSVPVIATLKGFCLGGGCKLAMSCDIGIASGNAGFGQP